MTDRDIIKALDWCEQFTENLIIADVDTKRRTLGLQAMQTCKEALKLINRQKAEIDCLQKELLKKMYDFETEYDSKIKTEAIKEFARKFKAKSIVWRIDNFDMGYQITDEEFDNLVKEMVGE